MWADWWGFKMEAWDGIRANIAMVDAGGACAMIHSDDENGIQRLNQEVAKALAQPRPLAQKMVYCLAKLNLLRMVGKQRNAILYQVQQ